MSTGAQVRIIPPIVYLVPFVLMRGLQRWRSWTVPGGTALTAAGLAMIAAGITLMLWSFVTLRRAHTTIIA